MKRKPETTLAGVDGCPGGWLAVIERPGEPLQAQVFTTFDRLIESLPPTALIGVDIPIGLPEEGARVCDQEARKYLGSPRSSSVFPAPLRACLTASTYEEVCGVRMRIDSRKMSRQAFGILSKIREVDTCFSRDRTLVRRV